MPTANISAAARGRSEKPRLKMISKDRAASTTHRIRPDKTDREERAGHPAGMKLLGRTVDHLVGQTRVEALRARHHLDRDQDTEAAAVATHKARC